MNLDHVQHSAGEFGEDRGGTVAAGKTAATARLRVQRKDAPAGAGAGAAGPAAGAGPAAAAGGAGGGDAAAGAAGPEDAANRNKAQQIVDQAMARKAGKTAPGASSGAPAAAGGIPAAPVQTRALPLGGDGARGDTAQIHAAAQDGVSGGGGSLPYLDAITQSFGPGHDLSSVQAHVGGNAADACGAIGASAYATGDQVAFAASPDLHTAAHEAAHVVQQRGGVQLYGGVGEAGDPYERNADAVADRVVAGQSAADLLGAGGGGGGGAVQRKESPVAGGEAPDGAGGGAAGAAADGTPGTSDSEQVVDFSAEHVGQEEVEGTEPVAPPHDLEGGKAELAGRGAALPPDGGAGEVAGGVKPDEGGVGGDVGGGGGEDEGPPSPEAAAAIQGAQADTQEALAQAEGESSAYQAEMAEKRAQFDSEQNALMTEKLKSMSPADKRATLVEMGWDQKEVKKIKDAELDALIEGKISAENRKAKIMGMTPEELAGLSAGAKIQHLVDLGIDKGDLDKVGQAKACDAFDQIMRVAHVPGQHKVKIKVKGGLLGKSWVVSISCDAEGNTDIQAKKEGGFLSKLWGWVKAALPIILVVLGPLTGGASLIVLAVYQAAMAIKNGNWLGAVIAVAGAVSGVGALVAAKGALAASSTLAKIASVAGKVKQVAQAAQAAMMAAKAKNAGSLLAALAGGAATFATFAANAAGKFAETMNRWSERLKKWAAIVQGAQKVAKGVRTGDPIGAIGGAFDVAVGIVGAKTGTGKALQRASNITNLVGAGRAALNSSPPNYGAVAEAALGIAGQLKDDRRLEDATRIVGAANKLKTAWDQRATNPAALAEAALELAQAIQVAKYDADHDETKGADGKPAPDSEREAIIDRYKTATNVVRAAGALITAASAKPRPNYAAALDAAAQLVAELTASKKLDAAAVVTSKLRAWTAAVNSKNEQAIMEAAIALGESINGLADVIKQEREEARAAAQANQAEGAPLPEDGGELPRFETSIEVVGTAPPVDTIPPELDTTLDPPAAPEVSPAPPVGSPRPSTPGSEGGGQSGKKDRYEIELKAWIPHDKVVDPDEPMRISDWLDSISSVVNGVLDTIPFSAVGPRLKYDYHSYYRGDNHAGYAGGHRVLSTVGFDFDGTTISGFSHHGSAGATHRDYDYRAWIEFLYGAASVNVTSGRGSESKTAGGSWSGAAVGTNQFNIGFASANPVVLVWAPDIDSDVNGTASSSGLTLNFNTDLFPSHGIKASKNGSVVKTEVVNDASGVSALGPLGAANVGYRLMSQSNAGTVRVP